MRLSVIVGLVTLVVAIRAAENVRDHSDFHTSLMEEIKKQEHLTKNKTMGELASDVAREAREAGSQLVDYLRKTVASAANSRQARGNYANDLLNFLTPAAERSGEAEGNSPWKELMKNLNAVNAREMRADTAENEIDTKGAGAKAGDYTTPYTTTPAPYTTQPAPNAYSKENPNSKAGAPVIIPIPGPPGPPGPPGLPGLPGLPGKTPNLAGLKAILLTKIAKLLLLIKAVAIFCLANFGGLLGLILGLVLPLYGKLKKAGVVVPLDPVVEKDHDAYGAKNAYGESGSYAPIPQETVDKLTGSVLPSIDAAQAKYRVPPPGKYGSFRR